MSGQMGTQREIGLFMPGTPGFFSDVLLGAQEFGRGRWCVETAVRKLEAEATTQRWKPDGLLISTYGADWEPLITRLCVPTVLIGGDALPHYPRVLTDDVAIGRTAAEYFLDRGFRHFAYCGYAFDWAQRRGDAYHARLAENGADCHRFDTRAGDIHTSTVGTVLADWLSQLPTPVAVFACHDRVAMLLAHACNRAGLAVPDAIALLGVDNNPLETGFTVPPISSVIGSARRIGYEAAALLEKLIDSGKPPAAPIRVAPAGVHERGSTDLYACDDADVIAALRFIRDHADEPISVSDVAKAVIVTRRMLERKFQSALQRSPHHQILKAHLDLAKKLLITTNWSMLDVALRSGFQSASRLSDVFSQQIQLTPTAFRRLYGMANLDRGGPAVSR